MDNTTFPIQKLKDRELVERALAAFSEAAVNFETLHIDPQLGSHFAVQAQAVTSNSDPSLKSIFEIDGYVCGSMRFTFPGGSYVTFTRKNSEISDECAIGSQQNSPRQQLPLLLSRLHFKVGYDPSRTLAFALGADAKKYYETREQNLQRLETLNEDLTKKVQDYLFERSKELADNADKQREKLDQDHQSKLAEIDQRRRELEEQKKTIDDRAYTHVRREMRDKLKAILKNRTDTPAISIRTQSLRKGINTAVSLLAGVSLLILIAGFIEASVPGFLGVEALWLTAFRSIVAGLGFAGIMIFYIRWQNHWFQQNAQEDFRLSRFEIDLDRASWIVEMALEWHKERNSEPFRRIWHARKRMRGGFPHWPTRSAFGGRRITLALIRPWFGVQDKFIRHRSSPKPGLLGPSMGLGLRPRYARSNTFPTHLSGFRRNDDCWEGRSRPCTRV